MRGSEFLLGLPNGGQAREQAVYNAVASGLFVQIEWTGIPVTAEIDGKLVRSTIRVSKDVLRVGDDADSVRVSVSARTAQRIADELGLLLPTSQICDHIYRFAQTHGCLLEPCIQPAAPTDRRKAGFSPLMTDTAAMQAHSEAVSKRLADLKKPCPVVCNAGKDWVVSNGLLAERAANYGWFSASAPYKNESGIRMWQTLGTAHNIDHCDYSQTVRLVHPVMVVDGAEVRVTDVAKDKRLCVLVSKEGVVNDFRAARTQGKKVNPMTPSFLGIDVSHHQRASSIPWTTLAKSTDFVMIRSSYGKMEDKQTAEHVHRARDVGLAVGLYHFFRISQEWTEQLAVLERIAERVGITDGDIVPALDIETDPLPKRQDPSPEWAGICEAFAGAIARHWGGCLIYTTQRDWRLMGSPQWIKNHFLWVPHWRTPGSQVWPPLEPATPAGMDWAIHQYGVSKGIARDGVQQDAAGCFDKNRAKLLPRVSFPRNIVNNPPVISEAETLKAQVNAVMKFDHDSFRQARSKIIEGDNE